MRQIHSRRRLLAMVGGAGVAVLAGCDPSTDSSSSRVASGASAAAAAEAAGSAVVEIAGQALVPVPAHATFTFKTDLTNRGTGESAPIAAGYWLGRYQVTNAQYKQFVDAGAGSTPKYWSDGTFPSGKEKHPVLFVSAEDAEAYCAWLTGKAGGWTFRLPTEAEWENAARGPQGWIDHDTWTGFVYTDVFAEISAAGGYTTPVGAYPDGRSHYGCDDLAGNAFEWISSLVTATNGAEAGKQVNAVRGGSWYSTGRSCQTGYRGEGREASGGYNTVGFRVAATEA